MGHDTKVSFSSPESSSVSSMQQPETDENLPPPPSTAPDFDWPFGKLENLDADDIRETAYEVFFTACRSSPGFGGRHALVYYPSSNDNNAEGGVFGLNSGAAATGRGHANGVGMAPTSRVKRALGLKMIKRPPSKRMSVSGATGAGGGGAGGPSPPSGHVTGSSMFGVGHHGARPRRPLTSAEIMRQQMKVTEQSDNRLRKTLMRTHVGQSGKHAETMILPLELLRHLKLSEFADSNEYHNWQKRQLKVLEAGLLLHTSIPLEKSNAFAARLREIIRAAEIKSLDIGKNSDMMRTLCNSVISLSWRSANGTPTDVCHWADGFPLNVHLYVALLQSIFDIRDETHVLDEVDELLELMKKTWSTLGITRSIHNICFTWVLFQQYVVTGQMEPDLLHASHVMLAEVAHDAKRPDREVLFVKILSSVLHSMRAWSEKRLLHYHEFFSVGTINQIDNLIPFSLTASKILGEDLLVLTGVTGQGDEELELDSSTDRVDSYIRSSLKGAFQKVIENGDFYHGMDAKEEAADTLSRLAKKTEGLALKEIECFSPILKKWHPSAAGIAAVTLHNAYGCMLKQYLSCARKISNETVAILKRAGQLENVLLKMVVDDSTECEDGGKTMVREMVPYEVDAIILTLIRDWIDERIRKGNDYLIRAKETETWNPKSKTEPYAQSAVEMTKLAKEIIDDFFEIPVKITEDLVEDLTEGLGQLIQEYAEFVASCGSKQNYLPTLPPLTRSHRDSKFKKLWRKANYCSVAKEDLHQSRVEEGHRPRPSTSRGTQRFYIRLNTLHYLLTHLHSLKKTISLYLRDSLVSQTKNWNYNNSTTFFETARSYIQTACQNVSEVAAYCLIFLDSNSVFYDGLYVDDVADARIRPALRTLKQNLILLCAILTDRAQPLAMKEVVKASFEAFLIVLLAGGNSRFFTRSDHHMVEEDFESLKRLFCTCGEGLINEDVVDIEAGIVEGVITLMSLSTELLIEELNAVIDEKNGIDMMDGGKKLSTPRTPQRWNRSDPNTILRVLCHRNDRTANQYLKKSFQFQLAKR